MFRPFGAIFIGSTVKGTCFGIAVDFTVIISYTVISIKYVKIINILILSVGGRSMLHLLMFFFSPFEQV
jgi:hypothetical protein